MPQYYYRSSPYLLEPFSISYLEKCVANILSPHHQFQACWSIPWLVSELTPNQEHPLICRSMFCYTKTDWDSGSSYLNLLQACCLPNFALISDRILSGMVSFIPAKIFQQKPTNQPASPGSPLNALQP